MSCGYCKHLHWDGCIMSPGYCKAARTKFTSPEGVEETIERPALEALEVFRKQNGGACPHFKRRTFLNTLFPWL